MENIVQIQVLPEQLQDEALILKIANKNNTGIHADYPYFFIRKRSIDARKDPVKFNLQVVLSKEKPELTVPIVNYGNVENGTPVHIIGAGPAGLFAALEAIELGLKPIVYERGKEQQCEGKRWYDLKRLGPDKLKAIVKASTGRDVADKHIYYPIPVSEMEYNSAIDPATDQNPGY